MAYHGSSQLDLEGYRPPTPYRKPGSVPIFLLLFVHIIMRIEYICMYSIGLVGCRYEPARQPTDLTNAAEDLQA